MMKIESDEDHRIALAWVETVVGVANLQQPAADLLGLLAGAVDDYEQIRWPIGIPPGDPRCRCGDRWSAHRLNAAGDEVECGAKNAQGEQCGCTGFEAAEVGDVAQGS